MRLVLVKNASSLHTYRTEDAEKLSRYGDGEPVVVDIDDGRNPAFNAKFWTLLRWGFENTEHDCPTEDIFKNYLFYRANIVDTIIVDGEVRHFPKRINFSDMRSDDEFKQVYNAVLNKIALDLSAKPELLDKLVEHYV